MLHSEFITTELLPKEEESLFRLKFHTPHCKEVYYVEFIGFFIDCESDTDNLLPLSPFPFLLTSSFCVKGVTKNNFLYSLKFSSK